MPATNILPTIVVKSRRGTSPDFGSLHSSRPFTYQSISVSPQSPSPTFTLERSAHHQTRSPLAADPTTFLCRLKSAPLASPCPPAPSPCPDAVISRSVALFPLVRGDSCHVALSDASDSDRSRGIPARGGFVSTPADWPPADVCDVRDGSDVRGGSDVS